MTRAHALLARLRGSAFAKDAAVLSLGTIGAQGITVAAMPLLTRLYTPTDFGQLAIFTAVSSIVATGITLRYETSILLPKDSAESNAVFLLSLALALILGIMCGIAAWLLPVNFLRHIGLAELGHWLPMAVLAGVAMAVLTTGLMWLNRLRAYAKMSQLRITQSVVAAITGLALGYSDTTAGLMLAQIIGLAVPCYFIAKGLLPQIRLWNGRMLVDVARKHQAAPRFLLPTALLDVVTLQMPVMLIAGWFGSDVAGQFSMAWRVLALPMALIGAAIGQVFFQRFSETWPDAQAAKKLLIQTWKALALFGFIPMVCVVLYGEKLFILVLGELWGEAGKIASIIAPMLYAMLVSSSTSGIYLVLGLQRFSLIFGMSFLFYRVGCIYLGASSGNLHYGLAAWLFCELLAISIYNLIAINRMKI